MTETGKPKQYDLEDRTEAFAKSVRQFIKTMPRSLGNTEDARQVIRSSGSVGANYIEANEALSKKDFVFRIKICRKEAKESGFWLRLLDVDEASKTRDALVQESRELTKIFGAILQKSQ